MLPLASRRSTLAGVLRAARGHHKQRTGAHQSQTPTRHFRCPVALIVRASVWLHRLHAEPSAFICVVNIAARRHYGYYLRGHDHANGAHATRAAASFCRLSLTSSARIYAHSLHHFASLNYANGPYECLYCTTTHIARCTQYNYTLRHGYTTTATTTTTTTTSTTYLPHANSSAQSAAEAVQFTHEELLA